MAKDTAKDKKRDKAKAAPAPTGPVRETPAGYVPRMKTRYAEEIVPKLKLMWNHGSATSVMISSSASPARIQSSRDTESNFTKPLLLVGHRS